jgi:superkiller protein 3
MSAPEPATQPYQTAETASTTNIRRRQALYITIAVLLISGIGVAIYFIATQRPQLNRASLSELKNYVQQHPNNPVAFYYLGKREEELQQLPEALQAYWKAISLNANYASAWKAWTPLAIKQMGPQQTYDVLNRFLQQHPKSAYPHLMMGLLLYQNGYFPTACTEAQQAATLDPKLLEAWQLLGISAQAQRDDAKAVIAFQHALRLQPKDWRSHTSLGVALAELDRFPEALQELDTGVLEAPKQGITHLELGKIRLRIAHSPNDYEAARAQLLQALALRATLSPQGVFDALHSLGQSYAAEGNWLKARSWLEAAEMLYPNDESLEFDLSNVYRHLGQTSLYRQAAQKHQALVAYRLKERALSEHIAAHPNDIGARLQLARLHARHGYLMEALRDYRLLLLRAPQLQVARQELEALIAKINAIPTPTPPSSSTAGAAP